MGLVSIRNFNFFLIDFEGAPLPPVNTLNKAASWPLERGSLPPPMKSYEQLVSKNVLVNLASLLSLRPYKHSILWFLELALANMAIGCRPFLQNKHGSRFLSGNVMVLLYSQVIPCPTNGTIV